MWRLLDVRTGGSRSGVYIVVQDDKIASVETTAPVADRCEVPAIGIVEPSRCNRRVAAYPASGDQHLAISEQGRRVKFSLRGQASSSRERSRIFGEGG